MANASLVWNLFLHDSIILTIENIPSNKDKSVSLLERKMLNLESAEIELSDEYLDFQSLIGIF